MQKRCPVTVEEAGNGWIVFEEPNPLRKWRRERGEDVFQEPPLVFETMPRLARWLADHFSRDGGPK